MTASDGVPEIECWACGAQAALDERFAPIRLYVCPSCGFGSQPERTAEELRSLYGAGYFEEYAGGGYEDPEARRRDARVRLNWIAPRVGSGRLFEVGPASGWFMDEARARGFSSFGVESGPEAAEKARSALGLDVRTGLLSEIDLAREDFDAVCMWHVLEHIPEPVDALRGLREATPPGGHLFCEVPNFGSTFARAQGPRWSSLDLEHHVCQFTPDALRRALTRAGWDVVEVSTVPFLIYEPRRRLFGTPRGLKDMALLAARLRVRPLAPHARKHELLRAVARSPR